MRLAAVFLLCSLTHASDLDFGPWTPWSPRPEIMPDVANEAPGKLVVRGGGNPGVFGGWHRQVSGIQPGRFYRLTAHASTQGLSAPERQLLIRLEWTNGAGKRVTPPEFAYLTRSGGASLEVPAPDGASSAVLQLYLAHAPQGSITFSDIRFEPVATPKPRLVTVAAVNLRPANSSGPEANVEQFARTAEAIKVPVDLIVFPEGITVVGTSKSYPAVAESAQGPTAMRLGAVARARKAWVVAGIYEREGAAVYNTAILLDREGKLAGKYRKVYLPREEVERGLTPGSEYPVFQTDFGKLGMMICYDVFYADPARALALGGAEIIAMPIWGGNPTLAAARSIENRVFLVSSGYDYPTRIQDPDGNIIASTGVQGSVAVATIDLNRRYLDPHLGDMRQRLFSEVRLDVPVR